MVQCASTGKVVAATGRRIYVFETVAGFTCMSLDHPQLAGYVTVETEELCCIFQNKPEKGMACVAGGNKGPFPSLPNPLSLFPPFPSPFLRLSRRLEKYNNHFFSNRESLLNCFDSL